MKLVTTVLCTGLLAVAPMAWAEEFSNTPKRESLQQAIAFEKYKETSAEVQARKDGAANSKTTTAKTRRLPRKTGQADTTKK
jgi:hypothetical protein